jgi:hypothetical protein
MKKRSSEEDIRDLRCGGGEIDDDGGGGGDETGKGRGGWDGAVVGSGMEWEGEGAGEEDGGSTTGIGTRIGMGVGEVIGVTGGE